MYLVERDTELTKDRLGKILQDFQSNSNQLTRLKKYYNYYDGKQAILFKRASDAGKPCNKIVVNYMYNITQNYLGYLTGIPIQYSNDNGNFDDVMEILKYNDVKNEDTELLRNALIFGRAFEINYIDEDGKQRFRVLDSRECIPVYDNSLNNDLMYVIRFWREDLVENNQESYMVEVYGKFSTKRYRSGAGFITFELIDEVPNLFNQVPITVFSLNTDEQSIFDKVMSLQDAYNELISGEVDDFDSFADAYLVLTGDFAQLTADDMRAMKEARALQLPVGAEATYLTKNISDTQIQNMLDNINSQIHKIACSPDFSQESFGTSSGIALRYRLLGFENCASAIESNMLKALQKRIELISSILNMVNGEDVWREVNIKFTRNIPVNMEESASIVNQLRGLVSDATLLTQIPFVTDVNEELMRLEEQNQRNMSLYNFSNFEDEEE